MASNWKDIIDELPGQIGTKTKEDAKGFIDQLLNDNNDFAQRQGKKITAYLSEYAAGELTADELKECIADVARLMRIQAEEESATGKQKLQGLATEIGTILLKGLIAALIASL